MSEGGIREEAHGRVWYGSTSLIMATELADTAFLAAVAALDVHVRLRALRIAHRRAWLARPLAAGPANRRNAGRSMMSECVRIDVDVQAPLIERRATATLPR